MGLGCSKHSGLLLVLLPIVACSRLAENYMERCCRVSLVSKGWCDPKMDSMFRSAACFHKAFQWLKTKNNLCSSLCQKGFQLVSSPKYTSKRGLGSSLQVASSDLDTILYVDCTKLGVLNQLAINAIGDVAERVIFRSPSRYLVLIPKVIKSCFPKSCFRQIWVNPQNHSSKVKAAFWY